MTPLVSPRHVPARPPGRRLACGGRAIPGLASGLTTRTRRPRPSEKTAPAHSGGLIPQGRIPSAGPPWRGGLRTPARTELASPGHVPIWPPGARFLPMIMLCLGLRPARICGRGDRAPPRESPSSSCLPTKPPSRNPCLARLSNAP